MLVSLDGYVSEIGKTVWETFIGIDQKLICVGEIWDLRMGRGNFLIKSKRKVN